MTEVSDRHQGDLDGQLAPWPSRQPLRVRMILNETADERAVQHAAWMLTNLLCRMEGVVSAVELRCPPVSLLEGVIPEANATNLDEALRQGAAAIDVVSVEPESDADLVFELGPGEQPDTGYRVHGDGWAGGVAAAAIPAGRGSNLPFGPYIAACLAAGRAFLLSRAPEIATEEDYATPVIWSAWSLRVGGGDLLADGPTVIEAVIKAGMAGMGAVGSAAAHTFWPTDGVTGTLIAVDADEEGVDATNLNRGVTFVRSSVGEMKAPEAARRLTHREIKFDVRSGRYQDQPDQPGLLLSAVDTNRARTDLQGQYPPRIIGASTYGLRAELVRCGPPGRGPCLRCYNRPEPVIDDDELRRHLRQAAPSEVESIAEKAGVSVEDAIAWATRLECGTVDAAMLSTMAAEIDEAPAQFAVAFVSAFAGTLLASEAIKETMGASAPLHDGANRALFQFLRPRATSNKVRFISRDRSCPACAPSPGLAIWQGRRNEWGPVRTEPVPPRGSKGSARPRSRFRPDEASTRAETGSGRETRLGGKPR